MRLFLFLGTAILNDQLTNPEQITYDVDSNWSTSVEHVCVFGDEHTFTIN